VLSTNPSLADEAPVSARYASSRAISGAVPTWEVDGWAVNYPTENDGRILDNPLILVAAATHMVSHRITVVPLRIRKSLPDVKPIGKRRALVAPVSAREPSAHRQPSQRQFPEIPTVHIAASVDKQTQRALAEDRPARNVCPVTLNHCEADTSWCRDTAGKAHCLRASDRRNGHLADGAMKDIREGKPKLEVIPLRWLPAQTYPPLGGTDLAEKVVTAVVAVEPDA